MTLETTIINYGSIIFLGVIGILCSLGFLLVIYEGWKKLKQLFKNKKGEKYDNSIK